jgi:rhodanese-related sulfurtransferase
MRRIVLKLIYWTGMVALCGSLSLPARAITVAALQAELASGNKVTVIDLRPTSLFARSHIPGAINIPASLCPLKNLPPLGKVIAYDDGLGPRGAADFQTAVAALAKKPGITVDILSGGYAAWQSAHGLTTIGQGMKPERFNYITYSELQAADPGDVIMVDLRKLNKEVLKNSSSLSDLSKEFPGKRVASSALPEAKAVGDAVPLIVLIDSADGSAEASARLLKARDVRRYAILVGGELSIERKGKPGLERNGLSYRGNHLPNQNQPAPHATGQ